MVNSVFTQEWCCVKCAESKNVEALVDQIRQNTKRELFLHKMSDTHYS